MAIPYLWNIDLLDPRRFYEAKDNNMGVSSYNQQVTWSLADVKPVANRILLLRLPDHPRSTSLVIPDVAQPTSHRGKVERCGPGKFDLNRGSRQPLSVKPGDIVQYMSCDVDDGNFVLIEEGDILFVES